MNNALAFTDNDIVTIAWSYGKKPVGCLGFALHRISSDGKETPLPSHAVFPGQKIKAGQTTEKFPVQKFYWKDPYARLVADKSGARNFRYRITPLEGTPDALTPMHDLPQLLTNSVTLSTELGTGLSATFNRGLISTQKVSRFFQGKPSQGALKKLIGTPGHPLRLCLAGDMLKTLTDFLARAAASGDIYGALYELADEELIGKLLELEDRLHLILSNSKEATLDPVTREWIEAKKQDDPRPALRKKAGTLWNRLLPDNQIGHNKFLVYADKKGTPKAVLLGSTNWTETGLCSQTNNTVVIEDEGLASRYLDYWKQLAADTKKAGFSEGGQKGDNSLLQGDGLRTWDKTSKAFPCPTGGTVESWFSPNMPSKSKGAKCPPDMQVVKDCIAGAQSAILMLAFDPGTPSIVNWISSAAQKNKDLFVRGCLTNKTRAQEFYYELKGQTLPKGKPDPRVLWAQALDGNSIPEGWQKEILKTGFAIIHDKIVVIDPFSDNCTVITGSHNLGYKASYSNDENLVIVRGNRKLAMAYATHVLDVYDHFSWRFLISQGVIVDTHLKANSEEWLAKYFDKQGRCTSAQLKFWLGGSVA